MLNNVLWATVAAPGTGYGTSTPLVQVGMVVLLVHAVMLLAGGAMGQAKAGSKASLVAGTISSMLQVFAFLLSLIDFRVGFALGACVAAGLAGFFSLRYQKTRKPMPALLLAGTSGLVAVLLVAPMILSLFRR